MTRHESQEEDIWEQEATQKLIKKFAKEFRENYLELSTSVPVVTMADFEKTHAHKTIAKSDIESLVKSETNHIAKDKMAKKETQALKKQKLTTGPLWYDMKAPILTPELRDEVKLIKLQHVLDKNYKFHKDDEKIPQHFEVGTFVDTHDDYHNRNTRKERNTSMADVMIEKTKEMGGKYLGKSVNQKHAIQRKAIMKAIATKKRTAKKRKSAVGN